MADESPGFLGRWSRRKTEVLQAKVPGQPEDLATKVPPGPLAAVPAASPALAEALQTQAATQPVQVQELPPALTLEDAQALTKDSDFKPFMNAGVGPDVRNAAMKKLFADPHFNVMDGLDTYIDDYSKSDPIPAAMLRQMTSSKFLRLFDDEEEQEQKGESKDAGQPPAIASSQAGLGEDANNVGDQTVAQSAADPDASFSEPSGSPDSSHSGAAQDAPDPRTSQENHANLDLRLQPDHAATAPGAGRGHQ